MRYLRLIIVIAVVSALAAGCARNPVKQLTSRPTIKKTAQKPRGFETVLLPGSLRSTRPTVPHTAYQGFTYEPMSCIKEFRFADVKFVGSYQDVVFYAQIPETQTPPLILWAQASRIDTGTNTGHFAMYQRQIRVNDKQPRVLRLFKENAELQLLLELPEQDNTLTYKKGKKYIAKAWLTNRSNKDIVFNRGYLFEIAAIDKRKIADNVSVLVSSYSAKPITLKAYATIARTITIICNKPSTYTVFCRVGCFRSNRLTGNAFEICDPPDIKTNAVKIKVN